MSITITEVPPPLISSSPDTVVIVIIAAMGCMVFMKRQRAARYRQRLDFSAFSVNPAALDASTKGGENSAQTIHDLGSQGMEWDMNNGNRQAFQDTSLMIANPVAEQF